MTRYWLGWSCCANSQKHIVSLASSLDIYLAEDDVYLSMLNRDANSDTRLSYSDRFSLSTYTPYNYHLNCVPVSVSNWVILLLLHPFNGLFSRTTWISWYQKGKTSLDLNEARDDGVLGWQWHSCTIRKQTAPCSWQITTPTHHPIFYRPDALPDAQPTVSNHWTVQESE